jgi:glycosyltransferase involved in cell wall biosynthesis
MPKKVLIVCAHRPGRSPSQRYRFEQYLPFLQANGFSFVYSYLLNEKDDAIFYSRGNVVAKALILAKSVLRRIKDRRRLRKFDIIFIQREASFIGSSFFEKMAARSGAYVIFDFDDSIWLADTSPGNRKFEWMKKPEKFFSNLEYAHCIIAGNEYLAEKARSFNQRVIVIPTTIDTSIHKPIPENRGGEIVTIGWSGSISTVKHFETLIPVLKKLRSVFNDKVRFMLIGDVNYRNSGLEVEALQWKAETEVNDLNSFDIGIMPLPDDEWARGKCGLKALSYMACGVATVASAVGVNSEIISQGQNGFLASNEEEWIKYLSLLVTDAELRRELGRKGRETVVSKYSVEANRNKYLSVFKREAGH